MAQGLLQFRNKLSVAPSSGVDNSDYRVNTYGPRDWTVDCTRSLASNGDGSPANPFNCNQAMTVPVAGDVVGWLPLSECANSTPVSMAHRTDLRPAFMPSNSGSGDAIVNRIVHVTKYAASYIGATSGKANIGTDSRRTELRHDGAAPTIVGGIGGSSDTGCATLGGYNHSYITYDGFYIDMAFAYIREDSGVIRTENTTGIHLRNFAIKGAAVTCASNVVMYRPQSSVGDVLSNFYAWSFTNDPTGSLTPQQAHFSDTYAAMGALIEHFEISNMQGPLRLKGTNPPGVNFNWATIRYGVLYDCGGFLKFNDLDATHVTEVHNVLCYLPNYDAARYGSDALLLDPETSDTKNLLVHHCTFAKIPSTDPNLNGALYVNSFSPFGLGSNVVVRDCIFDIDSGTFGNLVYLDDTLPTTLDYNYYTKNGSTMNFVYNGTSRTFAAHQSATSRDASSVASNTSPFVDRTNNNFRTTGTASTMSSTGGAVGAYGDTTEIIGVAA